MNPLKILQNRAIRLITGGNYYSNLDQLYKSAFILKIDDLFKHNLGCYAYRHQNELSSFARNHRYPTRNTSGLRPPFARLRSTEQSVIYQATNLWNNLPIEIKNSVSYNVFHFKYKQYLLNQYDN